MGAQLRPFSARRDLLAVADLVELCFADTLDRDGQLYIEQLRQTARSGRLAQLASTRPNGRLPMGGYVWLEDGRLVGNLSLIQQPRQKRAYFLIANVAVHPDYRRRGIARALTEAALADTRIRQLDQVWLQVDERNQAAIKLYADMGFNEMARRTSWRSHPSSQPASLPRAGLRLRPRRDRDWGQQKVWLDKLYDQTIRWNLPYDESLFQPGWRGSLNRMLSERLTQQWSAYGQGKLQGTLTWQSSTLSSDRLWLAMPAEGDPAALEALTAHARLELPKQRSLALNLPADFMREALVESGFSPRRTLIWMRAEQNSVLG